MPPWMLKAGVQGAVSLLPGRRRLNLQFQRRVTGNLELTPRRFEAKVAQARRHLENYDAASPDRAVPRSALELGTGWHPVVPIALALSGVERVVSVDIDPLADGGRARGALERFAAALQDGRLESMLPGVEGDRAGRLVESGLAATDGDARAVLEPLGIELEIGDARRTGRADGSFDLFVSNNTLEHIAPDVLRGIMAEFLRLAAPGAVMDHYIDTRDHYSSFDRSISRLNYLRYPEPVWRLFNNPLHYQNRLRASDYRAIVTDAGFRVVAERPTRGKPHEFDDLAVDRRFLHAPREDLFTLFVWLTAVAPDPSAAAGYQSRL